MADNRPQGDLLMRHRRRCQGPRKMTNRRKACDACVQAKVKCCYSQPTCSRCAKRGTQCTYNASSATSPSCRLEQRPEAEEVHSSLPTSSSSIDLVASSQLSELELPNWDFPPPLYPPGSLYATLADLENPPSVIRSEVTAIELSVVSESSHFTPYSQALSQSPASKGIPVPPPIEPLQSGSAIFATSSTLPSMSAMLARVLTEYPSLLTKRSFFSPFLHLSLYSLYSNVDPDMTFLPLTSTAICCGSGMNLSDDRRFFRRVMEAARQRLIGNFPNYECMQQWDGLHSMLIYESLEMRESIGDGSSAWNLMPRVKGLDSYFLFKMTETYCRSYPEIRNPDIKAFLDPNSSPCARGTTTWARWRITETARRTGFFANILNFYSNYDHNTGKQLPYYEPLNDDLILNMPLPCNQAAWLARDEKSWRLAIETNPPSTNHLPSDSDHPGNEALSSELFLKTILSKFTKEYLQAEISTRVGFGDSDELRRLIVLCASEQFA